MRKRILIALLVLALWGSVTAMASEIPDANQNGSLTLTMNWNGQPLEDGALTLFQVGQVAAVTGGFEFALIPQLADSDVMLAGNLDRPETAEALAQLAMERELAPITAPIVAGKVVFENLPAGLYVVLQTKGQVTEGFDPIRPFLISLPRWENGQYVYEITADPKVPLETQPTEPPTTQPPTEPKPTEPNLPQTGQLNWPVPILIAMGLALLVAGWIMSGKKKDGT